MLWTQFKLEEFGEFHGFVSITALNIIFAKSKWVNSVGVDILACECNIRHTYGLPCAHDIAEYVKEGQPIPIACIESYQKKLDTMSISNKKISSLKLQRKCGFSYWEIQWQWWLWKSTNFKEIEREQTQVLHSSWNPK